MCSDSVVCADLGWHQRWPFLCKTWQGSWWILEKKNVSKRNGSLLNVQDKTCTKQRNTLDYALFSSQSPIPEFRLLTIFSTTRQCWFISGITMLLLTFVQDPFPKNSKIKNCVQNSWILLRKLMWLLALAAKKNKQILLRKLLATFLDRSHVPMLVDTSTCHSETMIYDCLLNLSNSVLKGLENSKDKEYSKLPMQAKKNWQLVAITLRKSIFEAKQLWCTNIQ